MPHPLNPLPQCTSMNQRVHIDLFGPLKTTSTGKKYILVATDAFSKYAEMAAIDDKTASNVARVFLNDGYVGMACLWRSRQTMGANFVTI